MNITRAEYIFIDTRPYLCLMIEDKEALIGDLQGKKLDKGYVALLSRDPNVDWTKLLPPITVPANGPEPEFTLVGCTDDPLIVKMTRTYWNAVNRLEGEEFKEGPVLIPKV